MAPLPLLLLTIALATQSASASASASAVAQGGGTATWCVARSDATTDALQTALDYACGAGADCFPLQPEGLCFLPNTIQAHASYAFNSYYQRRARAPGSCDFAGTATIATSDPSYGSCVYPSTASAAGGPNTPTTTPPMNNPNVPSSTTTTPIYGGGNPGGLTPGMSTTPFTDNSRAPSEAIDTWFLMIFSSLIIFIIIS
ncbi:major pollen allergen Ole e 10 [Cajanus cajan]|uniref:Glucan endo-1,3-beta-glucosidase 1 n=1 Tax=Cajanus cajan TaxID=3821 RepID=A0A151QZ89_CAJCA|nr:major pollen allergen Ole e 10 [Cajanus cajan]KYP35651.1 Glucan endo-1,3-beta-glucosidase 1 [Cajanus cajan]